MPIGKAKIGLALSGGGAKGVCHLGMMDALLEKGFHFDVISGSSAGSVVGAMYANGHSPKEALEIFKATDFKELSEFALNWSGLLNIRKAADYLGNYLPKTFEELRIPFFATCTSMNRNSSIYFSEGPLLKVLLASCTIPVIFEPVEINGEQLVDGGVLDNLPIQPLKEEKMDFIIGLHCNSLGEGKKAVGWRELMTRSLEMSMSSAIHEKSTGIDLFMEPPRMSNYEVFDFKKAQEMYDIGYSYAKSHLEKIELPRKGIFGDLFD